MDADCKLKRQVNLDQLTALLDFLKEHPELAKGLTRGRRGKFHTLKIWNLCAKKMNAVKDGALKDGKGWSKYWCDWKYRVRRRALELKAAKLSNRPPPEGIVPLSSMEETILSIIGEKAIDGVVIKMNPLGDGKKKSRIFTQQQYQGRISSIRQPKRFGRPNTLNGFPPCDAWLNKELIAMELDSDDGEPDNNDNNEEVSSNQYYGEQSQSSGHKRRHCNDHMPDMDDLSGPSSPREKKPKAAARHGHFDDSDRDDEASEFLRLEREKLGTSKRIADCLETILLRMTRLTDTMGHIKDILENNRINL